jgi:SAM-dependent methyltransferase
VRWRTLQASQEWSRFTIGREPSPTSYGDAVADIYDEWYEPILDTERAVSVLTELAGGGPVLELCVGTGRVAVPLAVSGLRVVGIDISDRMLAKLRERPSGELVETVAGDVSDFRLGDSYQLSYCVFTGFLQLADARRQRSCLRAAAAHLRPGGRLVIEVELPDFARWQSNQVSQVWEVRDDRVIVELSQHHPAAQRIVSQYLVLSGTSVRLCPEVLRYVSAAELSLMAELSGLLPQQRWGGWSRQQLGDDSRWLVDVYTKH